MSVNIFELTVPGELRLDIANSIKMEKYQHFTSDITQFTASVIPFEVGAQTGHISTRNKENINKLHKFCKKNIKSSLFRNNISAITSLSSYYIFNCRNDKNWESVDYISPPLH